MADWPFVGRGGEQERIGFLLRGRPPVGVVLAGDHGVGKSRLAAWARDEATALGFKVRHAMAGITTAAIPFGALAALLPVVRDGSDTPRAALRTAADHLIGEMGDGNLLLSVDDAQHLDDSSIALLQQVALTPGLALLLTLRESGPALRAIGRSGVVERIDLEPLTHDHVDAILTEALDGPVSPLTVDTLAQLSQGNPLYLRELVLGSRREGALRSVDGLWQLTAPVTSPRLADLVVDRLADLRPEARRALDVVVVAGSIGYSMLVELAGEAAVEDLEREGLVVMTFEDRRRIVTLAHPVHAEVVRSVMTTRRSMAVNRLIADALEASGAKRRDDVLRIAVSRLDAGGEVSAPIVTEAARRAIAAHDLVLGERLARLAYESGGGVAAGLDLGGALTRLGRPREATKVFESIDPTGADDETRALLAMEWAECLFWSLADPDRAQGVLDVAWADVEDPEWRDQIIVTGAAYTLLEGRLDRSLGSIERIHQAGLPRGVTASALIAAPALALLGRGEEALVAVDRGLAAREDLEDELGLVHAGMLLVARTVALTELGRVAEAVELGTAGHAVAVEAGVDYGQAWFAMATGRAHLLAADFEEADRWFREAAARYEDLSLVGNRRWCLYGSAWALALQGQRRAAEDLARRARAIGPSHLGLMEPEMRRAEAALRVAEGDLQAGVDLLVEGAELAADLGLRTQEVAALHDLVRLGITDRVERLVAAAAELDGGLAATCARHGAAAVAGDGELLGVVSDAFADLGARLLAAEAAAQATAAFHDAGRRRDAGRWSVRTGELVAPGEAPGSPSLVLSGESAGLTEREREVATFAASGLASNEIARRLGLSRRTVDNHLHRAYTKLGVHGRDALSAALTRTPE